MLAAMQGTPPVFPTVHSPSSDCPSSNDLQPLSTPASVSNYRAVAAPQMIPVAMVPPPLLIGPGGTSYTIVPTSQNNEGIFNNTNSVQLPGGNIDAKNIPPTVYYTNPGQLESPESPNSDIGFVPITTPVQTQPESCAIEHTHIKLPSGSSPPEIEPSSFLPVVPGSSSIVGPLLERGSSSSDPQLTEHHPHSHCEGVNVSSGHHRRRRKKHSKRRRHHHHHEKHHPPATGMIYLVTGICAYVIDYSPPFSGTSINADNILKKQNLFGLFCLTSNNL